MAVSSSTTRIYDDTLRAPALPLAHRFPIVQGFISGAPVETIASGLARGERWKVGPAPFASRSTAIWLLDLDVDYRDQIAAWRSDFPDPDLLAFGDDDDYEPDKVVVDVDA